MAGQLLQWSMLLAVIMAAAGELSAGSQALPGCKSRCGDVEVPYPFGFGDDGCSIDPNFQLVCNTTYTPPKPFLGGSGGFEVLDINLTMGQMRVNGFIGQDCYDVAGAPRNTGFLSNTLGMGTYTFSSDRDRFFVTGCDTVAYLHDPLQKKFATGCVSLCYDQSSIPTGSCSGIGCCQIEIPRDLRYFRAEFRSFNNHTKVSSYNPCSLAFMADKEAFVFNMTYITTDFTSTKAQLPVVLEWSMMSYSCKNASRSAGHTYACRSHNSECFDSKNGLGYICNCSKGYQGNPYLPGGCQDIDECKHPELYPCRGRCTNTPGSYECACEAGTRSDDPKAQRCQPEAVATTSIPSPVKWAIGSVLGVVFLALVVFGACYGYKHMKLIHLRQKFFEQNGGIFLKRQMASHRSAAFSIFTLAQLERATDSFSRTRLLGEGGNGSVYKGELKDGREVAIKREKKKQSQSPAAAMKNAIAESEGKRKEFAGEMLILAGINHKNVVKLLGCCLEVEIPMLVYEYIANNTLSHHIHSPSPITFSECLRMATEAARALAYLHGEIEPAIIHGDIKPSNILLDDRYRVKVADFGTSIFADKYEDGQMGTICVKGTLGYLDPEYMSTGQPTDRSDVYSFGVVMMEMLSRRKDVGSLQYKFVSAANSGGLVDVVHPGYLDGGRRPTEQLVEVAKLAVKCMQPAGNARPSMVDVALALETIGRSVETSTPSQQQEPLISMEPLGNYAGHGSTSSSFSIEAMGAPLLEPKNRGR